MYDISKQILRSWGSIAEGDRRRKRRGNAPPSQENPPVPELQHPCMHALAPMSRQASQQDLCDAGKNDAGATAGAVLSACAPPSHTRTAPTDNATCPRAPTVQVSCPSAALRRPLPRQLPQPEPQGVHTESLAWAQVCPESERRIAAAPPKAAAAAGASGDTTERLARTPGHGTFQSTCLRDANPLPRTGSRGRQRDLLGTRRNMQAERRCNVRVFCVANHTVAAKHATWWSQGDGGGFQEANVPFAILRVSLSCEGEGRLDGRTDFSHEGKWRRSGKFRRSGKSCACFGKLKHATSFPNLRQPSRPFPVPVQARDLDLEIGGSYLLDDSSLSTRDRSRHWCLFTKERVW